MPARLLSSVLVVELLVVLLLVVDAVRGGVAQLTGHSAAVLAVLAMAGVLHTEIALRVERMRRRVTPSPHVDLSSVWTFAAALLLPPLLAGAVVVVIYLHLYIRVWRPTRQPAYRWVFTTATVLLAVHAAAGAAAYVDNSDVFSSGSGLAAIVTALLCYTAVNTCLVVGAVLLSAPERTFRQVLGRGDEVVLELATLSMGALAAGAISSTSPLHALLVLPPLVVLHRAVLVRHFQEVASIDGKTGLLNAAAWQDRPTGCCSGRSAARAVPPCSSSTSTTSSWSTTATATSPATACSPRSRRPCVRRCATTTSSAGSAARSS